MKVTITTQNVGQCFATIGVAKNEKNQTVFVSREVPFRFDQAARNLVEGWAEREGHEVVECQKTAAR